MSSSKTADSHIQYIYAKIGCSTRGAAVLFAPNGLGSCPDTQHVSLSPE